MVVAMTLVKTASAAAGSGNNAIDSNGDGNSIGEDDGSGYFKHWCC